MATAERQPNETREMVLLTVRVPRDWLDQLREAAHVQAISVADLVRMILRAWQRARYEQ